FPTGRSAGHGRELAVSRNRTMHVVRREEYDAVVVGSGIAGGWAAKELTEKGLRTLVIERGRNVEDGTDYITEHQPAWPLPIRYADVAPWYSYVERFIGVSGERLGLPQLPDGEFQPPMEMNAGEKFAKAGIERAFPDRRVTIGRVAILTESLNGRLACHYCG